MLTPPSVEDVQDGRVQTVLSGHSLIGLLIELWDARSAAAPLEADWALAMTAYKHIAAELTAVDGEARPSASSWTTASPRDRRRLTTTRHHGHRRPGPHHCRAGGGYPPPAPAFSGSANSLPPGPISPSPRWPS
ncbi:MULTISPECIES: hypothetical protein [Streptomyces]|uniref:hypothetical protein n=1 Tax=Streptomyces TaxID=1883 RepID=UPI00211D76C7|nr:MULTISPECIES: hypothetical protein [unclassified Streptomyces]WTF59806.1 hypothetical protein OH791_01605 [Streptomyces anulatus]